MKLGTLQNNLGLSPKVQTHTCTLKLAHERKCLILLSIQTTFLVFRIYISYCSCSNWFSFGFESCSLCWSKQFLLIMYLWCQKMLYTNFGCKTYSAFGVFSLVNQKCFWFELDFLAPQLPENGENIFRKRFYAQINGTLYWKESSGDCLFIR